SVIGMDKAEPLRRFVTGMGTGRFEPALERPTICGTLVGTDDATGLARSVEPIRLDGRLRPAAPGQG
ncbi:MAG TPA: YmdB family metallophosphoesterase, partial [Thermohalobaculum sp.]|nr:YmdB family metallophosphoesterase [Thermohalobaculum sp.]